MKENKLSISDELKADIRKTTSKLAEELKKLAEIGQFDHLNVSIDINLNSRAMPPIGMRVQCRKVWEHEELWDSDSKGKSDG